MIHLEEKIIVKRPPGSISNPKLKKHPNVSTDSGILPKNEVYENLDESKDAKEHKLRQENSGRGPECTENKSILKNEKKKQNIHLTQGLNSSKSMGSKFT